ncbi:MAG: anti-sigma factor [Ginsengibacter sp.]
MNKEDIISSGLLELYALGLSSPEETLQVEQALNLHPEVKQELNSIELSLESYARAHAIKPSSSVKDNILAHISTSDNKVVPFGSKGNLTTDQRIIGQKIYRIPSFFKLAAAAMLILLIGSIIFNYSYYNKYKNANSDLAMAQEQIKQNQDTNLTMKNELNVVSDKNARPVVLNGTPHAPDALAKIYWMKNTGEVYVDPTNLPGVPEGKQYQLWAIVDGKPVDAGMISTEKGIYHIQKMKSFGAAQAFAITLEKAGGSPTPTMDQMFVIAKI